MPANYERMTLHIPCGETRKYRAIFRALGLTIEKKNAIDRAMDDIEAGRVNSYSSIDEMLQAIV